MNTSFVYSFRFENLLTLTIVASLFLTCKLTLADEKTGEARTKPFSSPPALIKIFEDDFNGDSSGLYYSDTDIHWVQWAKGEILFSGYSSLSYDMKNEQWIKVELDLKFPRRSQKPETAGKFDDSIWNTASNFSVLVDLTGRRDIQVSFIQHFHDDKVTSEINVAEVDRVVGKKTIRTFRLDRKLTNGTWAIEYRHGLCKVVAPEGREFLVDTEEEIIKYDHSKVKAIRLVNLMNDMQVERMSIYSNPARCFDQKTIGIQKQIANDSIDIIEGFNDRIPKSESDILDDFHRSKNSLGLVKLHLGRSCLEHYYALKARSAVLENYWGDYLEKTDLLREARDVAKMVFGECHPAFLKAQLLHAENIAENGHHRKAWTLQKSVLEKTRDLYGKNHLEYGEVLIACAKTSRELGYVNLCKSLLDRALRIANRPMSSDPTRIFEFSFKCRLHMAMRCIVVDEKSIARNLLTELDADFRKRLESGGTITDKLVNSGNAVGVLYYLLGDIQKAESHFSDLVRIYDELKIDSSRKINAIEMLSLIYDLTDRFEKSEALWQDQISRLRTQNTANQIVFATYYLRLAEFQYKLKDYESALHHGLRAKAIVDKFGKYHPFYFDIENVVSSSRSKLSGTNGPPIYLLPVGKNTPTNFKIEFYKIN